VAAISVMVKTTPKGILEGVVFVFYILLKNSFITIIKAIVSGIIIITSKMKICKSISNNISIHITSNLL